MQPYLILHTEFHRSPLPCFLPCFIRLSPRMEADLHWEPESFASTWICLHPPGPPGPPGPGPPESAFSQLVHLVQVRLDLPSRTHQWILNIGFWEIRYCLHLDLPPSPTTVLKPQLTLGFECENCASSPLSWA